MKSLVCLKKKKKKIMKNKEYYKEQLYEAFYKYRNVAINKTTNEIGRCGDIVCDQCKFGIWHKEMCIDRWHEWLEEEYEEQPSLNFVEKRYLEDFLRPFKDRINYIVKLDSGNEHTFLRISVKSYDNSGNLENFSLPFFNGSEMYTGIKKDKYYTLKELKLFENEEEKDGEE